MLRDCNKTDAYFTDYLAEQERRIQRFDEKLDHLSQEQKPKEKITAPCIRNILPGSLASRL